MFQCLLMQTVSSIKKMPANKISISTNLMTVHLLSIFNLILSSQDNSPVRDNIRKIIGKLIDIYYIS